MNNFVSSLTLVVVILVRSRTCIVLAAESEQQAPDNEENSVKVEIVEKPSSCETSSQRGNVLKVHYTGYLLDGDKFDSR